MRDELRRYRSAILLILAFTLGLGAQILQAQVSVSPGRYRFGATIAPSTNDGAALGTASLSWSDLFLASGAVINIGNGELTLTATDANTLTLAGGNLRISNLTEGRVVYVGASGLLTDSNTLRFDGTNFFVATTNGRLILGVTEGVDAVSLRNEGLNELQIGQDDATPTAAIFKGPDARAGTDTDTAGGNITFAAGRGTGTGNPGAIFFQTGATNTPGTGAGPLTTRLEVASTGRLIIASHTRFNVASSTTGTGSALLGGNAPIGQVSAPYVWIAVIASDGTAAWIPAWR